MTHEQTCIYTGHLNEATKPHDCTCVIPHTCSPDKALMRVVVKEQGFDINGMIKPYEYIQTICPECGLITNEVEIKQK